MDLDWIRDGLRRPGKSQRGLARALGINPSGVSRLLAGRRAIKLDEIEKIAAYLEVGPPYWTSGPLAPSAAPEFGGGSVRPERPGIREAGGLQDGDGGPVLPALSGLSRDLPVLGTAMGGEEGAFEFNGEVVDYVRRPPGLEMARGAFAIYVQGESMAPRYEEGELVFVHPGRPARPGCDVIVELAGAEGEPGQSLLKRLVRRSADRLVLAQFNPPKEFAVKVADVKALHRVLSAAELLGV